MNTTEILQILSKNKFTKRIFRGVYPLDGIPSTVYNETSLIIVNTAKSNHPGEHWVALYIPKGKNKKKRNLEFFDSFGRYLNNPYFNDFLRRHAYDNRVVYNSKTLQSIFASTCGQYCCVYAIYKAKGKSLHDFLRIFTSSRSDNDQMILKLFNKYFKD